LLGRSLPTSEPSRGDSQELESNAIIMSRTLRDRLVQEAESLRRQAAEMPHGDLRDELPMRTRRDGGAHG
jgi:hypothetical protein